MRVSLPLAWPRGVLLARQSTGLSRPAPPDQAGHEHGSCPEGARRSCVPRGKAPSCAWGPLPGVCSAALRGCTPCLPPLGAVEEDVPCARAILAGR